MEFSSSFYIDTCSLSNTSHAFCEAFNTEKKMHSEQVLSVNQNDTVDFSKAAQMTCTAPRSPSQVPASLLGASEVTSSLKELFYTSATIERQSAADNACSTGPRQKRRNVKISSNPHAVTARKRREHISEKMRTLKRLVPGGTKMDTASMLDEAVQYVKFLQRQVHVLEMLGYAAGLDFDSSSGIVNFDSSSSTSA